MKPCAATMVFIAAALCPVQPANAGDAEIIAKLQQQVARCWSIRAEDHDIWKDVKVTFRPPGS